MKKILVMPDGHWLSHVSRPFEIAKVLRKMGHEVIFACEGYYTRLPSEAGFEVIPIKTLDPARDLACCRKGRVNWFDYPFLKELVLEELRLYDSFKPDLVLSDFRHSLSTSCEAAQIPLAMILNASWTDYYSIRVRPPEHFLPTRILGKRTTALILPWLKYLIVTFDCSAHHKLNREMGLRRRKNIWDIWRGDLNLIADIPEYGPTRNLPPNFHYIGPIIWEPEGNVPGWLESWESGGPVIYFTMGSTGNPKFFHDAIETFGNSQYRCIMTTAGMVNLSSVPSNFFVTDYAPGNRIMRVADAVVCHGGNGTIYQAMANGVPIIGIPTIHDQEFNMERVVDLGIGISLSERKFKPSHLAGAIKRILRETRFKENCIKYKKILETYDGPSRGASLIDRYLRSMG